MVLLFIECRSFRCLLRTALWTQQVGKFCQHEASTTGTACSSRPPVQVAPKCAFAVVLCWVCKNTLPRQMQANDFAFYPASCRQAETGHSSHTAQHAHNMKFFFLCALCLSLGSAAIPGTTSKINAVSKDGNGKEHVFYLLPNGTAKTDKAHTYSIGPKMSSTACSPLLHCCMKAFLKVYKHFEDTCACMSKSSKARWHRAPCLPLNSFDYKLYSHFLNQLKEGAASRGAGDAYSSYAYYPKGCAASG